MGSKVDDPLDLFLMSSPRASQYWFVSERFKNTPLVRLLHRDNQLFALYPDRESCRMENGWLVEDVPSTGKRVFIPERLLGSQAADMEVLAWASR